MFKICELSVDNVQVNHILAQIICVYDITHLGGSPYENVMLSQPAVTPGMETPKQKYYIFLDDIY